MYINISLIPQIILEICQKYYNLIGQGYTQTCLITFTKDFWMYLLLLLVSINIRKSNSDTSCRYFIDLSLWRTLDRPSPTKTSPIDLFLLKISIGIQKINILPRLIPNIFHFQEKCYLISREHTLQLITWATTQGQ